MELLIRKILYQDADGSRTYAMYKVGIMDVDYNIIKQYEQPDIYVSRYRG